MIEAGRYRVGWTRLSTGRRKRRAAALAAGTGMGSLGWGVGLGVVGNGDGRGPDATLSRFGGGGGSFLLPPVNCCEPVDGDGSDRGD